jgi:CBS domain-containing protein
MNIGDIMSTELVTCSPNETLSQVAIKMQREDIGACPVVENQNLVGIVTDRDIAVRAVAKGMDPNATYVRSIMTTDLVNANPSMSLEDACELMAEYQVRRLPVVEQNMLVGFVSQADLAIDLEEEDLLAETIERISEPIHTHSH